jgi:zinc transport system ATP-binding protein
MSEPLIRAENLHVRIGGAQVLSNISLTIARGEIVTLIGPNGSGKTTLLRALLGLTRPDSGFVQRKNSITVGYVPQHFARDRAMPLTVRRFMTLFGAPASEAIDDALARTGVTGVLDRQVATLSGGELARVLLARAIARRPDLLLLDEPLAAVDVAGEAALYRLIAELRSDLNCAILLVSHDLHVVMNQSDRVICLNGHICCEGTAETVARDPAFGRLFGARAASDLAFYTHHHNHRHDATGHVVPGQAAPNPVAGVEQGAGHA